MKRIAPNLYARGKCGSIYLRRRIPQSLKNAYPPKKTHVLVCLHTTDLRVETKRQRQEEVKIEAEFSQRLDQLNKKQIDRVSRRMEKMSDEALKSLADHWVRQVLETDEHYRERDSEDEFE